MKTMLMVRLPILTGRFGFLRAAVRGAVLANGLRAARQLLNDLAEFLGVSSLTVVLLWLGVVVGVCVVGYFAEKGPSRHRGLP